MRSGHRGGKGRSKHGRRGGDGDFDAPPPSSSFGYPPPVRAVPGPLRAPQYGPGGGSGGGGACNKRGQPQSQGGRGGGGSNIGIYGGGKGGGPRAPPRP